MSRLHSENFFLCDFSRDSTTAILDAEESHHALRVLRLRPGDELLVGNGQGLLRKARLGEHQREGCALQLLEITQEDPRPRWNLALALLKGDALEEPVGACTQLDIGAISLLHSQHCQVPADSQHQRLLRRLQAKSTESTKQAQRTWRTEIHPPVGLNSWLAAPPPGHLILLDPAGALTLPTACLQEECWICVGPEGGYAPDEVAAFRAQGAHLLSLGPTRLRAKTAPLYALGMLAGMLS